MNWDEIKDSLADVIVFLIKCLPVIFVIGYIIFYIAVFVEYKDVPMSEIPTWAAWMLFTKS